MGPLGGGGRQSAELPWMSGSKVMCSSYIHELNLALMGLDQPPLLSAQTLQDAVKGSDGLKGHR